MEQELARQAGVDELDGEVVESATAQFPTQSLKPLISDETAILGSHHNKENLVRELQKINKIASQKADEGCYKKLIVIDATTGQNALRQAEVFSQSLKTMSKPL